MGQLTRVQQALEDGAISARAVVEMMGRHAGEGRALSKAKRNPV